LKVSDDVLEAKGEMAGHVLKEAHGGPHFGDDPGDVWPEVSRIMLALAVAGKREGLAGISGSDEMNFAAPRKAVEGFEIVPDRSRSQGRVRHPCHEIGRAETVSLDITNSTISGLCDVHAEIQSGDTGAKAEAANFFQFVGGTNSHTIGPFRRDRVAAITGSLALLWRCSCTSGT
jgi:hypothetical protein